MEFLLEAFDESNQYPVVNLNPKMNPPQLFQLIQPGVEAPIVAKFGGTSTLGEKITKLTKSDKALQIVLFSLSSKGNFAELKNGLGVDPMTTISTIIQLTKEIIKTQQIDSIMIRYPAKKMKGRGPQLQRIFKAIAKRVLPSFTTLDEISEFDGGKHGYVVLYKKSKGLDDSALPAPNPERFTKVETSVGEKFVDDKTGKSVSKPEAIAATIADNSAKQTDKEIMSKTRISRQAMIRAQGQFIKPDFSISAPSVKAQSEFDLSAKMTVSSDEDREDMRVQNIANAPQSGIQTVEIDIDEYINDLNQFDIAIVKYTRAENDLWRKYEKSNPTTEERIKLKAVVETYYAVSREINQNNAVEKLALLMTKLKALNMNQFDTAYMAKLVTRAVLAPLIDKVPDDNTEIPDLDKNESNLIRGYTGTDYKDINNALLGLDSFPKVVQEKVSRLDDVIVRKGTKLPEDTVLYRLQRVKSDESKRLLENKVFYFRNFVSTSLKPLIFNYSPFGANATLAVTGTDFDTTSQSTDEFIDDVQLDQAKGEDITYAFVISKASRIKSLVLGASSKYPTESEVVLPRGTTLKINKIYGRDSAADDYNHKAMLLMSEVMDPELLDESVDVYDGDMFLSEGTLVPIKKSLFATLYESTDKPSEEGYDLLASIINTDVPEKFID